MMQLKRKVILNVNSKLDGQPWHTVSQYASARKLACNLDCSKNGITAQHCNLFFKSEQCVICVWITAPLSSNLEQLQAAAVSKRSAVCVSLQSTLWQHAENCWVGHTTHIPQKLNSSVVSDRRTQLLSIGDGKFAAAVIIVANEFYEMLLYICSQIS